MKKLTLLFAVIFISSGLFAQADKQVFLKWKLQPNENLIYKTSISEIDTQKHKTLPSKSGGFFNILSDTSEIKNDRAKEFIESLNQKTQGTTSVTKLTESAPGIINIDIATAKNENTVNNSASTSEDILKCTMDENGSIQSSNLNNDQKNLISLFFELPGKNIAVGDIWSLHVNLISKNPNLKPDTLYHKNEVRLILLRKEGTETIATVKYEIIEYVSGNYNSPERLYSENNPVKTSMKVTYKATAEFSIDKGRWISYNGIMTTTSSGAIQRNKTEKYSLVTQ